MDDAAHPLPDDDRISGPAVPSEERPSWLVSSDQGAEDELRVHGKDKSPAPEKESKPEGLQFLTSSDHTGAVQIDRPLAPMLRDPAAAKAQPEKPPAPATWAAAASSIPKLKLVPPPASVPPPRAARKREDEDDLNEDGPGADFPDEPRNSRPVVMAPPKKLDEPFWVVALDELRSNSRVQILTLVAVLLPLLSYIFWPRSEPGVSLNALRKEPMRWDGQQVRISGRVGEVFHVGAGCAFYLHQGRDTIVVFTRGAAPHTRDKVSIAGSISTGYLDGLPRQALFATP